MISVWTEPDTWQLHWLQQTHCLKNVAKPNLYHQTTPVAAVRMVDWALVAVNVQTLSGSGIIGVIEGGYYVDERLRSADETAKRPVSGVLSSLLLGFCRWLTTTTTVLRHFFRDYPGELVPEENFWTLWCKGRSTEADTPTVRLCATPSRLTSVHLHHPMLWH